MAETRASECMQRVDQRQYAVSQLKICRRIEIEIIVP